MEHKVFTELTVLYYPYGTGYLVRVESHQKGYQE